MKKPIKRKREQAIDTDGTNNPMQPIPPLETPAPKPDTGGSVTPAPPPPAPRMRLSRWVSGDEAGTGDKFGRVPVGRRAPRRSSWLNKQAF